MGRPRINVRPVSDWRIKVSPQFLEAAFALKAAILAQSGGNVNVAEDFLAKIDEIRRKFPTRADGPPSAADIIHVTPPERWPLTANDRAEGILSWLHWNRFRVPFWQDAVKERSNDVAASKRITQTIVDYDNRRSDPHWKPNFKIDLDHSGIFELGLTLGLEGLTGEELANCFDAVCLCGRTHSSDALRKQRDRLVEDLRRALAWELESDISHAMMRKVSMYVSIPAPSHTRKQ